MKQKLMIYTSGEIFQLPPEQIVGFMADGNYTNVILQGGQEFLLSFQLGQVEKLIREQLSYTGHSFIRVGKSLIVSTERILYINVQKQQLVMDNALGDKLVWSASRESLKKLMAMLIDDSRRTIMHPVTINSPGVEHKSRTTLLRGGAVKSDQISDSDIRLITG